MPARESVQFTGALCPVASHFLPLGCLASTCASDLIEIEDAHTKTMSTFETDERLREMWTAFAPWSEPRGYWTPTSVAHTYK